MENSELSDLDSDHDFYEHEEEEYSHRLSEDYYERQYERKQMGLGLWFCMLAKNKMEVLN